MSSSAAETHRQLSLELVVLVERMRGLADDIDRAPGNTVAIPKSELANHFRDICDFLEGFYLDDAR